LLLACSFLSGPVAHQQGPARHLRPLPHIVVQGSTPTLPLPTARTSLSGPARPPRTRFSLGPHDALARPAQQCKPLPLHPRIRFSSRPCDALRRHRSAHQTCPNARALLFFEALPSTSKAPQSTSKAPLSTPGLCPALSQSRSEAQQGPAMHPLSTPGLCPLPLHPR